MEKNETQKNPEISIIVPIYNVEPYLQECIDSILGQTYTDFEMILVDDGSPDHCPEICDMAAKKDARIRVIHQKNQGLSAARNAGIEIARGEWFVFVDSDDVLQPEYCQKLYKAALLQNADMSGCSEQLIDENGSPLNSDGYGMDDEVLTGKEVLGKIGKTGFSAYVVTGNKMFRKNLFQTLRYPDGRLNEDLYIFADLYSSVKKMTCVSERLYYYRQRNGSIMNSRERIGRLGEAEAFEHCFAVLKEQQKYELLPQTEKMLFAKLTGAYYGRSYAARREAGVKKLRRSQREAVLFLKQIGRLEKRTVFRTILFQLFPDLYGIRMKYGKQ